MGTHRRHVRTIPVETCLVKDLQFGYLGDNVIHVDFARVDLDEKVKVNMALDFHGTPSNAKKAGMIVVTNSGIHGAIAEVEDKVIWLEVAPEVELKISKGAVAEIITDDDEDENDDESADDLAADDADA